MYIIVHTYLTCTTRYLLELDSPIIKPKIRQASLHTYLDTLAVEPILDQRWSYLSDMVHTIDGLPERDQFLALITLYLSY